jgi:hypothetical protein
MPRLLELFIRSFIYCCQIFIANALLPTSNQRIVNSLSIVSYWDSIMTKLYISCWIALSIMSTNLGKTIPVQIQRQLRKECFYGCAICGMPLLKYAHIAQYSRIQALLPENMIALCPQHYYKYESGDLSESSLREAKKDPHNKLQPQDAFSVESKDLTINIGKCKFINTHRILAVDDFDLITVTRENEKYLLLDVNLFDRMNSLIATISENSWVADNIAGWDIYYVPQKRLNIRNVQRNITFEMTIENTELYIDVLMYYNNYPISITRNEISLSGSEIGIELKNTVLKNYDTGIAAYT